MKNEKLKFVSWVVIYAVAFLFLLILIIRLGMIGAGKLKTTGSITSYIVPSSEHFDNGSASNVTASGIEVII